LADCKILANTIRHIRKNHATNFRAIRNAIVAHRDLDGNKQLDALESIDNKTIHELASELDLWISKAIGLLTQLINDYSWSRLQIREIANKIEQQDGRYSTTEARPSTL
jgi:hypothetical protein